jgi:hypothetical protein
MSDQEFFVEMVLNNWQGQINVMDKLSVIAMITNAQFVPVLFSKPDTCAL